MLFVYRLFLDRSADVLNDGEIEKEGGERRRGEKRVRGKGTGSERVRDFLTAKHT